jgi:hypothetical protein
VTDRVHHQAIRWCLTVLCAAIVAPATAQVPPVWFGTWKVSVERSTYSGEPAYKRATYTIQPARDGLKVVYEAVLPRGGVQHLEWIGKLDGQDYPVQGIDEYMTYAYQPESDGKYELIAKIDGRPVATATVSFSPDGKTMTTTTVARGAGGQAITTNTVYVKSEN